MNEECGLGGKRMGGEEESTGPKPCEGGHATAAETDHQDDPQSDSTSGMPPLCSQGSENSLLIITEDSMQSEMTSDGNSDTSLPSPRHTVVLSRHRMRLEGNNLSQASGEGNAGPVRETSSGDRA